VAYLTHGNLIYYGFDPFACSDSQLILKLRIVQALDGRSVMGKASAYRKYAGRHVGLQPAISSFEWSKAVEGSDWTVIRSGFIAV
jgi:hypothetical protein